MLLSMGVRCGGLPMQRAIGKVVARRTLPTRTAIPQQRQGSEISSLAALKASGDAQGLPCPQATHGLHMATCYDAAVCSPVKLGAIRSLSSSGGAERYASTGDKYENELESAHTALTVALCALDASDASSSQKPGEGAVLRASALNALHRYTLAAQDPEGQLSPDVTVQVQNALAKINASAQRDSLAQSASPKLAARLQDSLTAGMVAFGVISYWRGIWFLWDGLVLPDDPLTSGALSAAVGLGVLVGARAFDVALAPPLTRMNQADRSSLQTGIVTEKKDKQS